MPAPAEERNNKGSGPTGDDVAGQRKRLFTVVAVVGVVAVLLGVFGLYDAISSPFPVIATPNTNATSDSTLALRQSDTDGDGLSDYDEIFTYQTSVFVKDSDSDGLTDSQEIDKGADPNCPTDQNCAVVVTNANTNSSPADTTKAITLRDSLRKAGVPSTVLDSTDDQTLLKTYSDVLGGTSADGTVTQSDLLNLSAPQVRSLLKSTGLSEETLNAVDDATLLQIYRDAIAE